MKYNAIVGMPRSGSTLLCNILNQNPKFHATTTSETGEEVSEKVARWSSSPVSKSQQFYDKKFAQRQINCIKGMISGWFFDKKIVFDKCRYWGVGHSQFSYVFPDGKIICMVRNPLSCIASQLKQDAKNPLLGLGGMLIPTIDGLCSVGGMVGSNANTIMDLKIKEPQGNIHFIKYEDLSCEPKKTMRALYNFLEMNYYQHDFENIENTCEELDVLYNNKFPHKGCGAIKPVLEEYNEWIPTNLQEYIMKGISGVHADGVRFMFENFYNNEA